MPIAEAEKQTYIVQLACTYSAQLIYYILLPHLAPTLPIPSHSTQIPSSDVCTPLNWSRVTIVLDLFISLKVHDDFWMDESEFHLCQPEVFQDLFCLMPPRARLEELLCAYLAPLCLGLTAYSIIFALRRVRVVTPRVGRSSMKDEKLAGSTRSIWQRRDDVLTDLFRFFSCYTPFKMLAKELRVPLAVLINHVI